ncbi:leucine-rich repeat flightless-interacting protein 2 isoform X7 [Rhinatrema bivittatum]|uniref:leucine-rich repeat flightless-interacting protein 2 isoform X7 n=1 Tax=Rhinatrema bivittatum TaxID=194408 RepID=UPI00112E9113|nr:leucine-rich repeat flightless-interacting protein 2 isoform X7 [Rhinatrema bivittatum]
MGTPGSGRKRTPVKDRFSAEDEALSHIAREAEARLAAKRAARAEARDIRMRELERQQKELSHRSHDRKWGQIQKWMEDSERAKYSHRSNHHSYVQGTNVKPTRNISSHRSSLDVNGSHRSRESTFRRRDLVSDYVRDKSSKSNRTSVTSGFYHDKRNYSSLNYSKPTTTYHTRSSSLYSVPLATSKNYQASSNANTGLTRSASLASLYDGGIHNSYSSRVPSEYSYSSRASSARSSPVCTDDECESITSSNRAGRGRSDSVSSDFSDPTESAADYFSRSNRRGSIVSDVDDINIPDLNSLDEKSDKQYTEVYTKPSSRNAVSGVPGTFSPLSGSSSRRGSGETSSLVDPDASLNELRDIYDLKDQIQDVEGRYMQGLKELKDSLSEVEEKYKKAMVSNAQLDNEKSNLIYQVDTLKDVIEDMEEQMAEYYRENEEKSKELERQKHTCTVLQHKLDELKEGIHQRDELIEKHGLVIIPDGTPNGDINHEPRVGAITIVSQEAAQVLEAAGEGPLDVRLRKLAEEKDELISQIRKLKLQLDEERQKNSQHENTVSDASGLENGSDLQLIEMQRDANRQISEFKFKLSKAEQDITTMEQNTARLEGQVLRYKAAAENAEKVEDELKAEKRKLQRELRTALDKMEEMEMTNSHLVKRLEKMKANRTALLSQQ